MERFRQTADHVDFCANAYECAADAHAIVIVTEWDQFRALDFKRLASVMACPVIVDLRNVYEPDEVTRSGFLYSCVGRPLSLSY
jgi:UDPglucose 6-dehydrogenase